MNKLKFIRHADVHRMAFMRKPKVFESRCSCLFILWKKSEQTIIGCNGLRRDLRITRKFNLIRQGQVNLLFLLFTLWERILHKQYSQQLNENAKIVAPDDFLQGFVSLTIVTGQVAIECTRGVFRFFAFHLPSLLGMVM